ncbi:MAG: TetR/AcrR family transcriptional regulator [Chlorobi bacterium]|nr:TetR/AcrR family transcriptional regulator [Chlorobiota bacterium]
MSPKTEKQNKEIRENKRNLIMMTSLELFAENGYHSTTISNIAKKAAISKGLLYNYFDSKESLLQQIIINGMENFTKLFDIDGDGVLTKKEMRYFISQSFVLLQENFSFWKIYFSLLLQPSVLTVVEKYLLKYLEPYIAVFLDFFQRNNYKNPVAEARFIAALLDGIGMHYIIDPANFPLNASLEKIYTIYSL